VKVDASFADDSGRYDAAADSGKAFQERKVSDCVALPVQPEADLLLDCAHTLGMLSLHTGEFRPLTTYEGSLGAIKIAGSHAVWVADNAVHSVSLIDGSTHQLARTFTPTLFAVSHDGQYVIIRTMRNANALLAVASDGSTPALEISDANTQKHRLQGEQNRLLYEHGERVASVDLATGEVEELGPTADSLVSSDGNQVAFLDKTGSKVIVKGSELREWSVPDPKPTFLVSFTRDAKALIVRHEGGMRRLTLESGEWSDLAAPPSGMVMQLDLNERAIIYQHALGAIKQPNGVFPDGFGLSAVPLNGEPSVMLGKIDSSYFRDFVWHAPGSFSADWAELIYPTLRHGLVVVDLSDLSTRDFAAAGCGEGAAGFSPDRQTLYYWVCDPGGRAIEMYALDRDGTIVTVVHDDTSPPVQFSPDSKHFAVQGREGFWLSALTRDVEFFAMDEQTVNTEGGEATPFFPFWRDSRHLVYNHQGVRVITLP
jgi:hypothetical protein